MSEFERELAALLNRYSMENRSDTPDFLLASFLVGCLRAWEATIIEREIFYGRGTPPATGTPQETK